MPNDKRSLNGSEGYGDLNRKCNCANLDLIKEIVDSYTFRVCTRTKMNVTPKISLHKQKLEPFHELHD